MRLSSDNLRVVAVVTTELEVASEFSPQPSKLGLRDPQSELAELAGNRRPSSCYTAGFTKGGGPNPAFDELNVRAQPPPFLASWQIWPREATVVRGYQES